MYFIDDTNYKIELLNKILTNQFKYNTIQKGGEHKKKWEQLKHNGILFPAEYKPHKKPLKYGESLVELTPLQEEYAMMYAKFIETDYIKNKTFNKNFWLDWKKILGKEHKIQNLEDCDFREYNNILKEIKELNKEKEKFDDSKFKIAYLNGIEQPVGNYRMEPPAIFLGRGDNPKIGKVKTRIYPEDVTLNIGKNEEIPIPMTTEGEYVGHKWGKIIHDKYVEWLASWIDTITGKNKYVGFGASSHLKASNDAKKFDKARKLKRKIKGINKQNQENMKNDTDIKLKQISTALYFIDKLALRIGNEKGDDEADTVGVTSLRLEHIKLNDNILTLDFLGKDSVRYYNKIKVDTQVKKNIEEFMKNKKPEDQLFDQIGSTDVNNYLQGFMQNLTAKVYRTYNASHLFQHEINKIKQKYKDKEKEKYVKEILDEYCKANAKVAKFLNHQKNISKGHKEQIKKINELIKNQEEKLKGATEKNAKKIKENIKKLKDKLKFKNEMKNISLGTSKANYIDPRITVSFMKYFNIPIDKLFTKALQKKFEWAFDVDETYNF